MANPSVLTQNRKLKVEVEDSGKELIVRLIGQLTEDSELGSVLLKLESPATAGKALALDLSKISQINSAGTRDWLALVAKLQPLHSLRFLHVNEVVIGQAGVVPGLLGKPGTQIEVFDAPYFCEKCQERVMKTLLASSVDLAKGFTPPPAECPKCGAKPLEFDAIEEEYFSFLKRSGR